MLWVWCLTSSPTFIIVLVGKARLDSLKFFDWHCDLCTFTCTSLSQPCMWVLFQLNVQDLTSFYTFVRLIQEEKQSTEARAEELESRVGSLEHMNLLVRGRSFERSSPPLSGRSTPKSHLSPQRDYLHKYHTVSSFLLVLSLSAPALILPKLIYCFTFQYALTALSLFSVLVMLVWIGWLNVFLLKIHQCALLYLKYIIEQALHKYIY